MSKFWRILSSVVEKADVLLMVLDARMVAESRNEEIEEKVSGLGKPLIFVINKCDLVERAVLERWKRTLSPCVFVSATKYHGLAMLRERILIEAKRSSTEKGMRILDKVRVGVLGYPNVGKSALINAMTGRGAAKTSPHSGFTRASKFIAKGALIFIDTPGVIPLEEQGGNRAPSPLLDWSKRDTGISTSGKLNNAVLGRSATQKDRNEAKEKERSERATKAADTMFKHVALGAIDYSKDPDPETTALRLIEMHPGKFEKYYGVAKGVIKSEGDERDEGEDEERGDSEDVLVAIAMKHGILKQKGKPDLKRTAVRLLKDWQTGKVR